jgi:hypothetical protein
MSASPSPGHHLLQSAPVTSGKRKSVKISRKPLKNTAQSHKPENPWNYADIFLNELDIATVRAESISLLNGSKCPAQETLPCSIRTL